MLQGGIDESLVIKWQVRILYLYSKFLIKKKDGFSELEGRFMILPQLK